MFVCLSSFVMNVVSLPVCVKVAHVCFVGCYFGWGGGGGWGFWGSIGNLLLCRMLLMALSSCWNSAVCNW
jgi:hypothetical protein